MAQAGPNVTVVMPTYRRTKHLAQAIESALKQDYGDFELIVTDNGPSEEIEAIVRGFGDSRISYRHNGGNIGPQRNILAGIRAGTAPYVTSLHDDDLWEPTFLSRLVPPLEESPDLTVSFCDYSFIDDEGLVDHRATEATSWVTGRSRLAEGVHRPFKRIAMLDFAIHANCGAVFRRSAIDWYEFPDDIDPVYDTWLCYLASRDGAGAYYVPERLARYRIHAAQMTALSDWMPQRMRAFERWLDDPRIADLHGEIRRLKGDNEVRYGLKLVGSGQRDHGRSRLRSGIPNAAPWLRAVGVGGLALASVPGGAAAAQTVVRVNHNVRDRWRQRQAARRN